MNQEPIWTTRAGTFAVVPCKTCGLPAVFQQVKSDDGGVVCYTCSAREMVEIERRYIEALMPSVELARRAALPIDCKSCNGHGFASPDEPCETCGGWTSEKRVRATMLGLVIR